MNMTSQVKTQRSQLLRGAAVLAALVVLFALGSPTAAFAHDAFQGNKATQGPEGSWLYTVTIPNPPGAPIVVLSPRCLSQV